MLSVQRISREGSEHHKLSRKADAVDFNPFNPAGPEHLYIPEYFYIPSGSVHCITDRDRRPA